MLEQGFRDPATNLWHALKDFDTPPGAGGVRSPRASCDAVIAAPAPVPGPRRGEARCPICFPPRPSP